MADGTLASNFDASSAYNASVIDHVLPTSIHVEGNNNGSFTLDLSGIDDIVGGTEASISPLQTPPRSVIQKLTITNTAISPPCSTFPAVYSSRSGMYSQNLTLSVKALNATVEATEMEIHEFAKPLSELESAEDLRSAESHQEISMTIQSVDAGKTAVPDRFDQEDNSWHASSIRFSPGMCANLLMTPRKSRRRSSAWFDKIEQEQEEAWNCCKHSPNSSFGARCDHFPHFILPEEEKYEESLASIGSKGDVVISNSDFEVENERSENSLEVLPQIILDSSNRDCEDFSFFSIPRFYFPRGIPPARAESSTDWDAVEKVFRKYDDQVDLVHMSEVCQAAKLCTLWKRPLYNCFVFPLRSSVCYTDFANWWERLKGNAHDEASQFVYILTNGSRNFLTADDLKPLIQDLIDTLPSLRLLKEAPAFHSAYIETVTRRIFWTVSRTWNKRISLAELRQSTLLKKIKRLETDDVNKECNFFSYEHFYVIFCKFFILDAGEKNYLTPCDLALYSDGSLTKLVIQRIFSGAVSSSSMGKTAMDFGAFVNFLLAEVDKCHPRSIEYWFRVMDLDGDGRISFDEIARFYNEIVGELSAAKLDALSFNDIINMMRDMISPRTDTYFILSDLKRTPQSARYFFNTFTNWMKHAMQEADPSTVKTEEDGKLGDWSRYCKLEYETLVKQLSE